MTDPETIELERFLGKSGVTPDGKPTVAMSNESIQLHKTALDLCDKNDFPYVNFYIGNGGDLLGIKPVGGADVDGDSYAFHNGGITSSAVIKELNVELTWSSEHFPVKWDEKEDMWIVLLNESKLDGEEE